MSTVRHDPGSLADKMDDLAAQLKATASAMRADPDTAVPHEAAANGRLLQAADEVLSELKSPFAQLMDTMVCMAKFGALRLFIKWDLLAKIPAEEGAAVSYEELAQSIGAETALVARLGAALVSTNVLRQMGAGRVAHTAHSSAYASPESPLRALACLGFDGHLKTLAQLPAYFDRFGLREPTGRHNTAMAFAAGDASLSVWDCMSGNPELARNMMVAMASMASKTPTVGSYDFRWVVEQGGSSSSSASSGGASGSHDRQQQRPLVVDVGGGKGHALQAIHDATPGLDMSRCVVQDLPVVVHEAQRLATGPLAAARFAAVDFHEEQPVKGALVYYIRRCLHDYGDDECVGILGHIADAMDVDSRLLIVEQVLTDPPSAVSVANDVFMAFIGGKERAEDGFRAILARAGLVLAELHRCEGTDYAVVECCRAEVVK